MGIVSLYNIAMNRSRGVGQFWSDWFNPEARLSWTLSCSVMTKDDWPREKKWKHVYIWSNKLHRAKQLGFEYPRVSESEMLDQESVKVPIRLLDESVAQSDWRKDIFRQGTGECTVLWHEQECS